MVFILDGEDPPELLPVKLPEQRLDVDNPCPPDDIMGFGVAGSVQVLEVHRDDPALQLLDRLERLDPGTEPVTHVAARPNPGTPPFAHLHDFVGVPVEGWLGVVVQRNFDRVLLAKALHEVEHIFRRLRHDGLDSQLFGKIKDPAAGGLVLPQVYHAKIHQTHTGVRKHLPDGCALRRRQVGVHRQAFVARTHLLPGIGFDPVEPESGHLLDRFGEGEPVERPGLYREAPTVVCVGGGMTGSGLVGGAGRGLNRQSKN